MLPCSFIIADDNSLYRTGLANLLKMFFADCITAQAPNGDVLLHALQQQFYDIAFFNVHLLPRDGFTTAETILQQHAGCRVVLYAHTQNEQYAVRAFAAGAAAFFFCNEPVEIVGHIVTEVLAMAFVLLPPHTMHTGRHINTCCNRAMLPQYLQNAKKRYCTLCKPVAPANRLQINYTFL